MITIKRSISLAGLLAFVVAAGGWAGAALAQQPDEGAPPQQQRGSSSGDYDRDVKAGTMSENLYRRLERVHDLIGEENYAEAEDRARDLVDMARGDYESAVAAQTLGHIMAAQDKYEGAVEQFRRAIELDSLPNPTHYGMMYNIAQLEVSSERYREGLRWLDRYFDEVPQDKYERYSYVLAASAHAELGNHRTAIDYIERAISQSDNPQEAWFQLLLAMRFELKEYREAAKVLERMIKRWPEKRQYWTQLSSVYLELNEDRKALAVLDVAETEGLLERETEWKQLVQLYLFLDIPFKGAETLHKGIEQGMIERDKDNLELLGNAWYSAREIDRAIEAFSAASRFADDGKLDMRRAYLLVDKEDWDGAREALAAAIDKGGLDNTGNAYVLLGMANFELGDRGAARRAFNQARQYEDSRRAATQWLRHLDEEESEPPPEPQDVAQN